MEERDYIGKKTTGWAFLAFGLAMTVANVVAYLHFLGLIN